MGNRGRQQPSPWVPGVHDASFRPAPWCRGPHLQTLWPFFFRRQHPPSYRRERLELADGDFVDLDWCDNPGPLVLLLHGLEGCSRSHYIMGNVHALHEAGYATVVMQFRGCSGEPNRLDRSYHAGDTGDIDAVVRHIVSSRPLLAVVGYSLGGNAMLKWLAEFPGAPVSTAVAVSVPYRLGRAADRMNRGFSQLYQRRLIGLMHAKARARFGGQPCPFDLDALSGWKDFRAFDDNVTAPLHGFSGVDAYYTSSSSRDVLHRIQHPTLLLHAIDDPFMTPDTVPDAGELGADMRLEIASTGGHVGFVAGGWRPRYWVDERLVEHLDTCCSKNFAANVDP